MSNLFIRLSVAYTFVFISLSSLFAQKKEEFRFDHRGVYEVTYLLDSLDQSSHKKGMTELLMNDKQSLFRSFQKAQDDSSYMAYLNTQVITMSAPTVTSIGDINAFNYQVLKDYTSGETKVYDEYMGGSLSNLKELSYYFEPQEAMSGWVLGEDTLTINGYVCQRADIDFGGRKWTAWFAPEIAEYSDGPYKFRGLPGLIFRIYDANKTWNFELTDLSKIDTIVSINFKEGLTFKETTKEEIYKDRRHFQKNQMELQEAAGYDYGEHRKSVQEKLDDFILHDNNWIELL